MTEEPYRWLEAVENRREYVQDQLKGGSPAFGVKLADGILLLGVGSGNSKVFELFDRHAMTALGHPADIEKIRQAAIDAAHMEAFTRAPEDVSLRRLISFGLSPQLKTNFEQIFSAPFIVEMLLAEISNAPETDLLVRLHYDGGFQFQSSRIIVAASPGTSEKAAQTWLNSNVPEGAQKAEIVEWLLQAWWILHEGKSFTENVPAETERKTGWRSAASERIVEMGWLARHAKRAARFQALTLADLGLKSS
jgi:proteasome alpha subunit